MEKQEKEPNNFLNVILLLIICGGIGLIIGYKVYFIFGLFAALTIFLIDFKTLRTMTEIKVGLALKEKYPNFKISNLTYVSIFIQYVFLWPVTLFNFLMERSQFTV